MIDPDMPAGDQRADQKRRSGNLPRSGWIWNAQELISSWKNPEELYLMRSIRCLDLHPSACIRCSGKPVELDTPQLIDRLLDLAMTRYR